MAVAVILLGTVAAVMSFLFIMQKIEIKNITKQLADLKRENTNSLIHAQNGTADNLINEINSLLKETRKIKTEYNHKNHELNQMMTNISHDLRTPLTAAMGYINLVQNSDISEEEKRRELAVIEKRLSRLEELINSFFELSKTVSGEKEPDKTEINLIAVLEESIAQYYYDYTNQNRKIIFNHDKNKIIIFSNKNMLMRIFDNLISNALKHGKCDLTVTVLENKIIFANKFDTQNIDLNHIFDEFYTADISRTKGNTGLGLAIAKQFTEILGLNITAKSENNLIAFEIKF